MANHTRIQCSKCRKRFDWHGQGRQWCTACRGANAIREQANAAPDYAEMATVVVEMVYNTPRRQFTAEHHRAVNVILKRWEQLRRKAA